MPSQISSDFPIQATVSAASEAGSPAASPQAIRVQRFLRRIDRLSERLGQNVPAIVEPEQLRSLPLGTFGRAWIDWLDQRQLTPFTTGFRRKQLHDGIHVLTGYDSDAIGEAEVQAFLLGAKFRLVHVMLGLGLLRALRQSVPSAASTPLTRASIRTRLWVAYQRGRRSVLDIDTWQPETLWNMPLRSVQQQFLRDEGWG